MNTKKTKQQSNAYFLEGGALRKLKVRNCGSTASAVIYSILHNSLCSTLVKDDVTMKVSWLAPSCWYHLVAMIPSKVAQSPQSVSLDHAIVGVAKSEEAFHRTLNPGFFAVSVCLANVTQH